MAASQREHRAARLKGSGALTISRHSQAGLTQASALTVDCANGVGAPRLNDLLPLLKSPELAINVVKSDTPTRGALNSQCGADYVKTQQTAPPGIHLVPGQCFCSFDGDADRVVFYYANSAGTFRLLDGDKIATLAAAFIMQLVKDAALDLSVAVVQTAYANGSSTRYVNEVLGVPVDCVPTGVKYLHHAAEKYDIGVYFEANGHGTVLFSPGAIDKMAVDASLSESQASARKTLRAVVDLINQTVGDAISDMLLVESILLHRGWGPGDWDSAYEDLPNRLVKVLVKDRFAFTTEDAERKVKTPEGLQVEIDATVAKFAQGRSFVRPSGTEDCVRVYAEAATREQADGKPRNPPRWFSLSSRSRLRLRAQS